MKIIDIAICIDNVDPIGIGRIRAVRYNDYIGEKEKAMEYTAWDDKDPFVCLPFLPPTINFIPSIQQAVKIINYNTNKETVNQEYIPGPFTTSHDFNSQTYSQQVENLSYGVTYKHAPAVFDSKGNYINKRAEFAYPKNTDNAIYGKNGSDVLFTENGIILRGGKLLSKGAASVTDKKTLLSQPLMGTKSSKLYLKKFSKTMELINDIATDSKVESSVMKYVVEYDVDDLITPTKINFYLHKIDSDKAVGTTYLTTNFNEYTPITSGTSKFITTSSGVTTFSVSLVPDDGDLIKNSSIEIRHLISSLHDFGLKQTISDLNINTPEYSSYPDEDLHPFYFRPTYEFVHRTGLSQPEQDNRSKILSNIEVSKVGPSNGLIWSQQSVKPKTINKEKNIQYGKIKDNSPEQSFGALVSDKIYFLSTNTNETNKPIDFNNLDKYDYTQSDYIEKIGPNTYSTVRGENLIKFLYGIINLLLSHEHNLVGPLVKGDPNFDKLMKLIETIENDLLNNSIRIN